MEDLGFFQSLSITEMISMADFHFWIEQEFFRVKASAVPSLTIRSMYATWFSRVVPLGLPLSDELIKPIKNTASERDGRSAILLMGLILAKYALW
jgi:hypothetical protein